MESLFSLFHVLFWTTILVLLMYYSYKQIQNKETEDFEDRDN